MYIFLDFVFFFFSVFILSFLLLLLSFFMSLLPLFHRFLFLISFIFLKGFYIHLFIFFLFLLFFLSFSSLFRIFHLIFLYAIYLPPLSILSFFFFFSFVSFPFDVLFLLSSFWNYFYVLYLVSFLKRHGCNMLLKVGLKIYGDGTLPLLVVPRISLKDHLWKNRF